jgi:dihydromethanopterin reductase
MKPQDACPRFLTQPDATSRRSGWFVLGDGSIAPGATLMADVRAMLAIGQRGQLGLNGRLPWEGNTDPEYVADVQRFFDVTRGHVLLSGPRTKASIPDFVYEDRTIHEIRSSMQPEEVISRFPGRVIFIGGGPPVWAAYASLIRHWDVTRLPYDGEADRFFDPNWLVQTRSG